MTSNRPSTTLLLTAVCALILSSPAQAELNMDVEESMVRIYNFVPERGGQLAFRLSLPNGNQVLLSSSGTGFVISNEGHIITNQHVTGDNGPEYREMVAQKIGIELAQTIPDGALYWVVSKQGGSYKAFLGRLVWSSVNQDLAIIQCADLKVHPLPLSFLDLPKGAPAYSLGYPGVGDMVMDGKDFDDAIDALHRQNPSTTMIDVTTIVGADPTRANLFSATMTSGTIERPSVIPGFDNSAGNSPINVWDHDLRIRHGNSGGPFLNGCSQVIGVVGRAFVPPSGDEVQWAMRIIEIKPVLERFNVKFTAITEPCMTGKMSPKIIASIAVSVSVAVAALLMALFKSPKGRLVVSGYTQILEDKVRSIIGRQGGAGARGAGYSRVLPPLPADTDQTIPRGVSRPTPAIGGSWTLTGRTPDGRSIRLDLTDSLFSRNSNRIVLGRAADVSHLPVSDSSVSKQHAQIRLSGGRFYVADRNSANGTMVNGHLCREPFKEHEFHDGDTLTLGEVRLEFQKG